MNCNVFGWQLTKFLSLFFGGNWEHESLEITLSEYHRFAMTHRNSSTFQINSKYFCVYECVSHLVNGKTPGNTKNHHNLVKIHEAINEIKYTLILIVAQVTNIFFNPI